MKRAAESTYQAVLYVLRQQGVARPTDNWMLPRLAEFSPDQMQKLLAAMRRLKATAQWPNVTDQLIRELELFR